MYVTENARLVATSAKATGLPLVVITLAAGLGICFVLYRVSRWLSGRTHRVLNPGLLLAGAVAVLALAWLAVAYAGARGDLLTAQSRGSAPVEALARVGIASLQAHADESLTLIDNQGDDTYQSAYLRQQRDLGPGPGTLLTLAEYAASGSQASGGATAAVRDAQAWYAAHVLLRKHDDNAKHAAAVQSALGSGRTAPAPRSRSCRRTSPSGRRRARPPSPRAPARARTPSPAWRPVSSRRRS